MKGAGGGMRRYVKEHSLAKGQTKLRIHCIQDLQENAPLVTKQLPMSYNALGHLAGSQMSRAPRKPVN